MSDGAPEGRRPWKFWNGVISATLILASAGAAGSLRAYSIPSASMSPTLSMGDRVLGVNGPLAGLPQRGEVWVFRSPASQGGRLWIKRVVGVPGDTVSVAGGRVAVNGAPLAEPYLAGPIAYSLNPTTLGAGQYFVLGDNRNNSNDSHTVGPVPGSAFVSKVNLRFWPLPRAGSVR